MGQQWAAALAAAAFLTMPCTSTISGTVASGADPWIPADQVRPVPDTIYINSLGTEYCRDAACRRNHWLRILKSNGLVELQAPPRGKAYRWLWIGVDPRGPSMQIPGVAFAELSIAQSGQAQMRSSWTAKSADLAKEEVATFEAALVQADFVNLPAQVLQACFDECPEWFLEAAIDGKYRYFASKGDPKEPGVLKAMLTLENLARSAANVETVPNPP